MATKRSVIARGKLAEPVIEPDDEDDDGVEDFPLPEALLKAAGVETDEDWDAIPAILPPVKPVSPQPVATGWPGAIGNRGPRPADAIDIDSDPRLADWLHGGPNPHPAKRKAAKVKPVASRGVGRARKPHL